MKRLTITILYLFFSISICAQDINLAPTPPMGWNSWNFFEDATNEQIIMEIADAMVKNGMKDAGYQYIIIDDYWVGGRDSKNQLYPDPMRFPNGMKAVADYVHSKGLKLGIYSDAAEYTCGGVIGSYGFENLDAKTFASWGIDYLKYDYCNAPNDVIEAFTRYKKMGDALKNSGRNIVLAICEWGQLKPWLWAKAAGGHLWRTTYDSRDCWKTNIPESTIRGGIIELFDLQEGLSKYSGPNGWNDPDMLMIGLFGKGKSSSLNGKLLGCNQTEYNTNFALWCMLSAPLIVNCDLRNIDKTSLNLIKNKYLLSIDQDTLGKQCNTLINNGTLQVLKKELSSNKYAICILNRSDISQHFDFNINKDFNIWYPFKIFQVWCEKTFSKTKLNGTLDAHGCEVYIISYK